MRPSRFAFGKFLSLDPISRRELMDSLAMMLGGMALLAGTTSEAEAKMPQKASQYQTMPKGPSDCGNCSHFEPPKSCGIVAGTISPKGWCRFYVKK